jgi:hypothetical protein
MDPDPDPGGPKHADLDGFPTLIRATVKFPFLNTSFPEKVWPSDETQGSNFYCQFRIFFFLFFWFVVGAGREGVELLV